LADSAASGLKGVSSPVSVNCTLPVPYQVTVNSNLAPDLARLGSTILTLADPRGFAHADARDLLQSHGQSIRAAQNSEYSLLQPVSLGSPTALMNAARCSAENADPGTMTVTVVY
jgi:hypothetical protein